VFDLVEVRQNDFGGVPLPLLGMATRELDFHMIEPPPVREALAVVQTGELSEAGGTHTVDFTVGADRDRQLQRVPFDLELVLHITPITGVVAVLHIMPIGTLLLIGVTWNCAVAFQIDRRLAVQPAILRAALDAPAAVVLPGNREASAVQVLVRPSGLFVL